MIFFWNWVTHKIKFVYFLLVISEIAWKEHGKIVEHFQSSKFMSLSCFLHRLISFIARALNNCKSNFISWKFQICVRYDVRLKTFPKRCRRGRCLTREKKMKFFCRQSWIMRKDCDSVKRSKIKVLCSIVTQKHHHTLSPPGPKWKVGMKNVWNRW